MKKNSKIIIVIILILAMISSMCVIFMRPQSQSTLEGTYQPVDEYVGETYVGFLRLEITNEIFNLYDIEAGNPCIKGAISKKTDTKMILKSFDYYEDVPKGWVKRSDGKMEFTYQLDGDTLVLENCGLQMNFKRVK